MTIGRANPPRKFVSPGARRTLLSESNWSHKQCTLIISIYCQAIFKAPLRYAIKARQTRKKTIVFHFGRRVKLRVRRDQRDLSHKVTIVIPKTREIALRSLARACNGGAPLLDKKKKKPLLLDLPANSICFLNQSDPRVCVCVWEPCLLPPSSIVCHRSRSRSTRYNREEAFSSVEPIRPYSTR